MSVWRIAAADLGDSVALEREAAAKRRRHQIEKCIGACRERPASDGTRDDQHRLRLEQLNAEIKGRTDVSPNEPAIMRLAGALLLEQNDEWQLQRRYLPLEGLRALADNQPTWLSAVVSWASPTEPELTDSYTTQWGTISSDCRATVFQNSPSSR
jgi:hypothetical protein